MAIKGILKQSLIAFALVTTLLLRPGGLEAQGGGGARAMLEAAARGDAAQVRKLLADGAPVDPRDGAGRTPLLVAVAENHLAVALALIEAGADINAQAANQDSPWLLGGARGRTQMLEAMIPKGPNFALRNRFGGSALIPACHYGHVDTVKLLLTTKINVNHVNNLGWTCLLELVILGDGSAAYVEIAKLVLAAGADPNIADKERVSPLQHARRQGQQAVAKVIEAAGGR